MSRKKTHVWPLLVLLLIVGFSSALFATSANLEYTDPITDLTGSCFLQGIRLTTDVPDGLSELDFEGTTLYGVIPLAGGSFPIAIDLRSDGAFLFTDPNQTGMLEEIAWEGMSPDGRYLARVVVHIYYEEGASTLYQLFLVWNPQFPIVLTYCRGAYYGGSITLKGVTYRLAILDDDTDGRYDDLESGALFIDVDQDGSLLTTMDSHEQYGLDESFNIDGMVYRVVAVAADGSQVEVEESGDWVEEKLPLEVGHPAPTFAVTDTRGREVALDVLKGQIVLLDFWASWCEPCIAELPTIKAIVDELAADGVTVLGINLDRSEASLNQAVSHYGLTYQQIYDGENETISSLYRIVGVPMSYVVDHDGIIRGKGLRGQMLRKTIETLLSERP